MSDGIDIWSMIRRIDREPTTLTHDECVKLLIGVVIQSAVEYFHDDTVTKDTRMYDLVHSMDELEGFQQTFPFGYQIRLKDSVEDIARGFAAGGAVGDGA